MSIVDWDPLSAPLDPGNGLSSEGERSGGSPPRKAVSLTTESVAHEPIEGSIEFPLNDDAASHDTAAQDGDTQASDVSGERMVADRASDEATAGRADHSDTANGHAASDPSARGNAASSHVASSATHNGNANDLADARIAEVDADDTDTIDESEIDDDTPVEIPQVLHRLSVVRQQQGVSHRNIARRLGTDIRTVRRQELETTDLPLSMLYAWQQVLEVPIADLLVDSNAPLSAPVMERARLVKLMKTAAAMMERAESNSMRRMIQMLVEQLIEIMPELKDVGPWHAVGQRRTLDDYGRVVEQPVPEELLRRFTR